jgi:hypothetical protein
MDSLRRVTVHAHLQKADTSDSVLLIRASLF